MHSLRWKLLITYVIVSFLPLMFFSNTVYSSLQKHYIEERKLELLRQANVTAGHIVVTKYLFDESKNTLFKFDIQQTSKEINARIIVVDAKGIVRNDSNNTEEGKTYVTQEIIEALEGQDIARTQPKELIYAAASISDDTTKTIAGVVLISASTHDITVSLKEIQKQLYLLTCITSLIVGLFSFFVSGIVTGPLKVLLKVIQKMTEGHLDARVVANGKDEISELGTAFNHMVEKLQQVDSSRQEFVSNVSHELKTPLSSIKVLSESLLFQENIPVEMYREFLQDINSEIDRMTEITNDLLTLVRLDQRETPMSIKLIYINKMVQDILRRMVPLSNIKDIDLIYESFRDVYAEVDEMKLTLAISNLIENGIKYTPSNGMVKVILDADHQNSFITVQDTGIGIPEEEQIKIFERFYRTDKTRARETGGTGLGLSITHRTILLHHGSIKVTSRENEGSVFTVRIPLRQSS